MAAVEEGPRAHTAQTIAAATRMEEQLTLLVEDPDLHVRAEDLTKRARHITAPYEPLEPPVI